MFWHSVKFIGQVVDEISLVTDLEKLSAITAMTEKALMLDDGVTPSQKMNHSFLGIVMYYQRFIKNCSRFANLLFTLTAAPKGKKGHLRGAAAFRKLKPTDWMSEHQD